MKFKIGEYRLIKPAVIKFLKREGVSPFKISEASATVGCPIVAVYQFAYEEGMIGVDVKDAAQNRIAKFYKYDEILEE